MKLILDTGIEAIWSRVEELTNRLCNGLESKNYRVFSPRQPHEQSGIVIFDPPDSRNPATTALPRIIQGLEQQGIVIVQREGRLRASPHFYNTPQQIDSLVDALP